MPSAANAHSSTGRPPAGVMTSRRTAARSSVGSTAISHSTSRMPVALVDHGSDIATATASQSAASASRARADSLEVAWSVKVEVDSEGIMEP